MKIYRLYYLFILFISAGVFADSQIHTAVVKSTQVAGQYIYIQTDGKDKEQWLATTVLPLKAGDRIEYRGGLLMEDFPSKTLKRTFKRILFITQLRVVGGATANPGAFKFDTPATVAAPVAVRPGEVEKLENGKTVDEVLRQADELNGHTVRIRAKVVKFTPQVLGKNWVTVKDGSGSAPNDKLIVTTQQQAQAGDLVVIEGTARTQVDLGSGYTYPILLEKASLKPDS